MKTWYKKQISHYESDRSYFSEFSFNKNSLHTNQEFGSFINLLNIPKKSKVLEIGAGDGGFTKYLLSNDYDITALDLSLTIVNKIYKVIQRTKYKKRLKVSVGNVEKLNFKNNTFDACVCVHVLHHVDNIEKAISEMTRVVKKGGIVGFIEPNPFCPYWYFFVPICKKREWSIEKGLVRCSKGNLNSWMKSAGLTSIKNLEFGFVPSFIMKNSKFLARLELFLNRIPGLNYFSGVNLFKGIKK